MSRAVLVNYNLKATSTQYSAMIERIKEYGTWCPLGGSVWVVVTTQTPSQVFDVLTPLVGAGEQLICIDISNDNWVCEGYSAEVVAWLQKQLVHQTATR